MHRLFTIFFIFIAYGGIVAHPAYGIVMDHQGNLYFTDIMHNGRGTLWKLDKYKKLTAVLKDFHAHNVNIDTDGNIYSAHGEDTHSLIRILPSGEIDALILEDDISKFFGGNCVVAPNGDVYFGIEKKIWKWAEEGRMSIVDGEFKWNQGFYVDEVGKVYATEIGLGRGGCLVEIDQDGIARVIADNLINVGDRDFDPTSEVLLGVNKDEEGNLYVADLGGKRIVHITPDGMVSTHYQSESDWKPCGIYFRDDEEYILEIGKDWKGPRIIRNQGSTSKIYFDYDTHQNSPKAVPKPGEINIPWTFLAVFLPVLVFAIFKLRIGKVKGMVEAAS